MNREFLDEIERIENIGNAASILNWDQEVMMPEEGTPARSRQLSALSKVSHELLTSDRMSNWIGEAEPEGPGEEAILREVEREHRRAVEVPDDLVEEITRTSSEAFPVWREAKEEDDFDQFAPLLEKLLGLKREYAEHIDPDAEPYRVLFEDFEPYIDLERAEEVLTELKEGLSPLIDEIADASIDAENPVGTVPEEEQMELARAGLRDMGFDFDRGRIDTSPHPFSTGNQFDARVTTRFVEDPLDSLTSAIHEMGHALYTQGLPQEHYGTPLGKARELTVHESQSRLWENHVGRSLAFWKFFTPRLNDTLGTDASAEAVYRHLNTVEPHPIRVESDELTYHMHIVLRFEIERDLVSGDLDVEEVPSVWRDKMEQYLGIRPENDARGCLQDIHWAHGSFGYFPTYSLGSALAAQLYDAAEDSIENLEGKVRSGRFDDLRNWLRDEIHSQGQRHTTEELIERATGSRLSADPFLEYAERKFGGLYDL